MIKGEQSLADQTNHNAQDGANGPSPYERVQSVWMESPANNVDFAPPALTNQWAMLSAGRDVFSYEGFASPPVFAHELQAQVYVAIGDTPFVRMTQTDTVVRHHWRLDQITRRAEFDEVQFETKLAISAFEPVAMQRLHLTNTSHSAKRVRLLLLLNPDVATTDWIFDPGYEDRASTAAYDNDQAAWIFSSKSHDAWAVIQSHPAPASVDAHWDDPTSDLINAENDVNNSENNGHGTANGHEAFQVKTLSNVVSSPSRVARALYEWDIEPGKTAELKWVHALSTEKQHAQTLAQTHLSTLGDRFHESLEAWKKEWKAAFTPGNELFSGHMPTLQTDDERLQLMYDMAVGTVLYCKRSNKRGMGDQGFVYATGLPSSRFTFRVTSAFLWDIKMIAGMLSMLDPLVLRTMMEVWMEAGLHNGYGVDFITGQPLGFWYAINDHALIHMAWQYLRHSGDMDWLGKQIGGKSVRDHLLHSARYWRHIAGDDQLADYGQAENLLECVSTYTHKVASFNAANVWNMRTVATILEALEEVKEPARLRKEADQLAKQVLTLYVPEQGFWTCKQPDGSFVAVRHVLDFFSVMLNMTDDLTPTQKDEMVAFFKRELQEPGWMHALSQLDPDTAYSSRTDHQDDGAYTTWPAYSIEALVQAGYIKDAFDWLGVGRAGPGIADVARQGPYGQAYHHGGAGSPMVAGSAAKAPLELPHIEKPVLVSGGKYAQIVIEYLAGVSPGLSGSVIQEETARYSPVAFSLRHIPIRGTLYRVDIDTSITTS